MQTVEYSGYQLALKVSADCRVWWQTDLLHENCALLGYYAASSCNFLPAFRDNLSVSSSGVKNPPQKWILDP